MTEWWVSQKKHFCEICKVWHGGHIQQIMKHRSGRMHQDREEAMLKSSREREAERKKEEQGVLNQIAAIERAAAAAMVATPNISGSGKSPSAAAVAAHSAAAAQERATQCHLIEATVEAAKRRRLEQGPGGVEETRSHTQEQRSSTSPTEGLGAWLAHKDPNSGQSYYYNPQTGESRWQLSPEMALSSPSVSGVTVVSNTPAVDAATCVPSSTAHIPANRENVEPAAAAAAATTSAATHPQIAASNSNSAWTTHRDPTSGQSYFYNASTGESRWQPPPTLAASVSGSLEATQVPGVASANAASNEGPARRVAVDNASSAVSSPLPSVPATEVPGSDAVALSWAVVTDPGSGRVYYHNSTSGISQWERPADFKVDVSNPPPPPSGRKPPPPPPRSTGGTTTDATAGRWVEVRPEDSMWGNSAAGRPEIDSDDEQAPIDRIVAMKGELMARAHRRGELADEDFNTYEREMRLPHSNAAIEGASEKTASFRMAGKRATGIRRRGGTGD